MHVCFICNEVRVADSTHKYRDGGLGTCESESAAQRLMEASQNITDTEHRFCAAKQRLDTLLGGQSLDVWVAEIRYHNSCYKRFIYSPKANIIQEFDFERIREFALNNFLGKVYTSILHESNAYLLNDILKDF